MATFEQLTGTYDRVPADEISARISRFQSLLAREGISGALILQLIDRYYFSGTAQDGVLIIPVEGEPKYLCRRTVQRAREESPIEIVSFRSFKEIPLLMEDMGMGGSLRLGMELDVIPAALYQRILSLLPDADWVDLGPLVREARAVKSPFEIDRIRAAGIQVGRVMELAAGILKVGMREVDFASRLEQRARELGHQGILRMRGFNQELFYGHIFSGEHAALISHLDAPLGGKGMNPSVAQGSGFRTILRGDPVVVDFVGNVGGYLIDQTRIMVVGELEDEFIEGFGHALAIQDAVVSAAVPGAPWCGLWDVAMDTAKDLGVADRFLGPPGEQVRFVGHGIGLEVDEYPFLAPRLDHQLLTGMVFALEPKIFHPGKGITGIEDTYLVTADGLERLTVTEREIIRV